MESGLRQGVLLMVMALAPWLSARAAEVRDLRLWASPDNTRMVLDLSGSVSHSLLVLRHPDRVVLDVAAALLGSGAHAPGGAGLVRQGRMARRPGGELRIVLDLARAVRARSFLAAPTERDGYRLVVELGGSSAAQTPVRVEHARPQARDLIVAVDAGHGGDDPGAIGLHGTREKDVVLAIAKALARQINQEAGMRAVLTRDGDYFVPLRDRMRRARAKQADLFVSVHADSIRDRSVDGSSVYILSQRGATDEAARWLAERENAPDRVGGVCREDKGAGLGAGLRGRWPSAALSASQMAAEQVLQQLNRVGEVRKPAVQQARFVVLKSPDIPSMLVETAYISNPQEEQRLRGAAHQEKLAGAIHEGLHRYFYADPPPGTRVAQLAAAAAPAARPALVNAGGGSGT